VVSSLETMAYGRSNVLAIYGSDGVDELRTASHIRAYFPRPGSNPHWNLSRYFMLIVALVSLGIFAIAISSAPSTEPVAAGYSTGRQTAMLPAVAGSLHQIPRSGGVVRTQWETKQASLSTFSSSAIGGLSVPRLEFSAMVREGIDGRTLRLAGGPLPVLPASDPHRSGSP
jgi:hypothetical protein